MISAFVALGAIFIAVPPNSVQELAALQAAAVARWESVDATFEMPETSTNSKYTARLRKAKGRVRVDEQNSKSHDTQTAMLREGRVVSVSTGPTFGKGSATIAPGRDAGFMCNPTVQLILGTLYPDRVIPLAELLSQPGASFQIDHIKESGQELIKLDLSLPVPGESNRWSYELYFDPSINYLARRCIMRINGRDEDRTEREVLEFRETSPGIYYPMRSKSVRYQNGKPSRTVDFRTIEVKVNEPIEDSVFEIAIPVGARVFDRISGKQYDAGASGQPSGPAESISTLPLLGATATFGYDSKPTPYQQRTDSSINGSRISYFTFGLGVALFALLLFWRKRSQNLSS